MDIIEQAMFRLDAETLSFCLMGNHYHLVVRTRQPNLSRLMRQINGEYTRAFNRRHGVTGHLFQGRFHAILVDSDAYLVEVCRYVELNPVRAGLVESAADWPWSSYGAHTGMRPSPSWLATRALHGYLLGRDAQSLEDHAEAARLYAATVANGMGADSWRTRIRNDIFLGEEAFVAAMQALATRQRVECKEINKTQRQAAKSLAEWIAPSRSRQESFRLAYSEGGMTMLEIARQAGVSLSSVSRLIALAESLQDSRPDTAIFKT
jgi:REP element-mobilizing transposase RayT